MATIKIHHAQAGQAPGSAATKITTIKRVGAAHGVSAHAKEAFHVPQDLKPLSLDADGNCRINIFQEVPQGPTMRQYPYSRCYAVSSTSSAGQVVQTSGFALSATRVLTSNVHLTNIEQRPGTITVARSYQSSDNSDGPITTTFDSHNAAEVGSWGADQQEANIGLRYCMLAMADPLTITDSEGDNVFTTITSVLAINKSPDLQLITRRVTEGDLVTGTANGAPRRITNGSVAEWYVTDLGGWLGRFNRTEFWDFMRGSPIFVTEESGPITGPLRKKVFCVGLVTDEVVASDPCTVNAGLFVDDGAVTRLLNSF